MPGLGGVGESAERAPAEAGLRNALDELALDSVRLLTKWVPLAYLVTIPVPFLRFGTKVAVRLMILQALCALALGLIGGAERRSRILPQYVRLTLAATLGIPTLTQLLQTWVANTPDRAGTYAVHIVGMGLFCLPAGWLAGLLTASICGWGVIMVLSGQGSAAWGSSFVTLGTALFVALLARATRVVAVSRTEQLRREDQQHLRQAQANEALFRGIMNRIHDVFFRTDLQGNIEMISPSVERYGYRAQDLVGTNALQFYADARQRERLLRLLIARGQVTNYEIQFLRKDGERVFATMNVNPLLDEDGRIVGLEGLLHDITAQKEEEARQKAEAQDAATLAYVGQELIASLDEPTLLGKLCELTTQVFECDASHTFLVDERGVTVAAGHGDSQEQWESLRVLEIPADIAAPLLGCLRSEGVVQTVAYEPRDPVNSPLPPGYGITAALYFPLRRRDEIVGFQSAAFRGRSTPLPERKVALARRIAHLASLALENARLLDALERANDFKTRFLANMSHELRTPLNVIMGYNQILLDHGCGPLTPEQTALLERVQGNAGELLDLVCATLELSREETQRFPLEISEVDVNALLDSLAEERRALANSRGLEFRFASAPNLRPLLTDARKLRMVLKNLIDNAFKFTESGSVTVEATPRNGGIQFAVSDTGIGIPPEERELIFEPFHQGGTPSGSLEGVGLGLYIVRTVLRALHGTIELYSQVGQGSTFLVWLPWDVESEEPPRAGRTSPLADFLVFRGERRA